MPHSERVVNTCDREAAALPAQTRSAAADSGHHERCLHAQVLGEVGGRRVGVFTRQRTGNHHGIPEVFERQPEEVEAGGAGVDDRAPAGRAPGPTRAPVARGSGCLAAGPRSCRRRAARRIGCRYRSRAPRRPVCAQLTNEQPSAARIPQTLDARPARPLVGESLVIAVVTRHGTRLNRMRGGNPAKAVEGDRFSR